MRLPAPRLIQVGYLLALAWVRPASATRVGDGPIQKAIQLLGELQTKLIQDGEVEQANFEEFGRFCERTSIEKQNTIKDLKEQVETHKASRDTASSNIGQLSVTVEELSGDISTNEKQAKEGQQLRSKEHQDFLKRDGDLGATVDMLARAHRVLEANLKGGDDGAVAESLSQVTSTLRKMVDASFVELEDRGVIEALLQQTQDEADGSADLQPQADADAYKEKSGSILDTLQSMKEKAEVSRNEMQKQEMKEQHSHEMLVQATNNELATLKKQLDDTKSQKSKNIEQKATSEGSLDLVNKDVEADEKYLSDLQKECMTKADEFQTQQKESAAEILVLKEARMILMKSNAAALDQEPAPAVDSPSFLQLRSKAKMAMRTRSRSQMLWERQRKAADYLTNLGDRSNNWVLAQVGAHVQNDPFGKVREMIQAMVEKLLNEQAEETEHKAWCDQEIGKTQKSLTANSDKLETINTRVDEARAESAKLGEQIKALLQEISQVDNAMQEATGMRQKENTEFLQKKKDLEKFQQATASAVQVLRNYYEGKSFVQEATDSSMTALMSAKQPAGSAASSIIGMLEVAESDFSKGLAEAIAAEDSAAQEYEQAVQDSKVSRAEKAADAKNKQAEQQRLDSLVGQTQLDAKDTEQELGAVQEYMDKLKGSCETKAPSHEERQARRKEEMEGLQNALAILEGKALALLETQSPASLLRR